MRSKKYKGGTERIVQTGSVGKSCDYLGSRDMKKAQRTKRERIRSAEEELRPRRSRKTGTLKEFGREQKKNTGSDKSETLRVCLTRGGGQVPHIEDEKHGQRSVPQGRCVKASGRRSLSSHKFVIVGEILSGKLGKKHLTAHDRGNT